MTFTSKHHFTYVGIDIKEEGYRNVAFRAYQEEDNEDGRPVTDTITSNNSPRSEVCIPRQAWRHQNYSSLKR